MKRSFMDVIRSLLSVKSYRAALRIFLCFPNPFEILMRYTLPIGRYPWVVTIRTPVGQRQVTMNSFHDVRSLMVVFAKEDYGIPRDISCAVDFGSNIGMSGLYFLTRNAGVSAYLFEPLKQNSDRLEQNLAGLEKRYTLEKSAIGIKDGVANFIYEASGRYGGIEETITTHEEVDRPFTLEVNTINAAEVLRKILEKEHFIDMLKVNIEGQELDVLKSLTPDILERIGVICAEISEFPGELEGFSKAKYGRNITRFTNRLHKSSQPRARVGGLAPSPLNL